MDDAVKVITELVLIFLAMTGAPGFQDDTMPMEKEYYTLTQDTTTTSSSIGDNIFATAANLRFVGFDLLRV